MLRQLVIRYSRKVICFIAILLMAAGCHHRKPISYSTKEPDLLPARVASAQDPGAQRTLRRLLKRGVKVISIGQNYLVSIPADSIFGNQSPRIRWESYALLNEVVCYLKQFRKIGIDVTAFSSKYVSPARERALTSARSQAVADYLWTQDIDGRFIFTRGLGSDKPIFFNRSGGDDSPNARVEITFRNEVE
jgi:intracellular multiplication protein IcmN